MRLHPVPIDIDKNKIHVDVDLEEGKTPFIVVYCQGEAKITYLPEHGETKVVTHQGKVKRVKFDEGEDF
ncbi:XtrA/YqaO family protein [Virgibacillus doumboii]|uniref:XtrA/YqaO family protein n=1 Tax=Virgibacillus doumboii TaxID=2697503 RepID=UPI0013E06DE4|nr:XtrA/YqaO family protein [Virgibacillus doumboii]